MAGISTIEPPELAQSDPDSDSEKPTERVKQVISFRLVREPSKLVALLKRKYGKGNYTVEMRHNMYTIWALTRLTSVCMFPISPNMQTC
jgi:hypothetical protein